MPHILHPGSFMLAAILVIVIPGPATFFVLGCARGNVRHAAHGVLGIVAGDLVLITISGLGMASLLSQWPGLLNAIKMIGALYLLYLGIGLIRGGQQPATATEAVTQHGKTRRFLLQGALLTLTNPKPVLFFAAFFPMFIDSGNTSTLSSFYTLGLLFELLNLGYFALLILTISRLQRQPGFHAFLSGRFNKLNGIALAACSVLTLASVFS
jgi:leucine efflux protein